jgi:hypothetical protein
MRLAKLLLIGFLCVPLVAQTREQIKRQQAEINRAEKEQKRIQKEQQQAMLRRDSFVQISAPVESVKGELVDRMSSANWSLETDSQFGMTFNRMANTSSEVWGLMMGAHLRGDDPSLPTIHVKFTIVPNSKTTTTVRFSTALSYSTRGGRTFTSDNGGMKTYKPEILTVLDEAKAALEQKRESEAPLTDVQKENPEQ